MISFCDDVGDDFTSPPDPVCFEFGGREFLLGSFTAAMRELTADTMDSISMGLWLAAREHHPDLTFEDARTLVVLSDGSELDDLQAALAVADGVDVDTLELED